MQRTKMLNALTAGYEQVAVVFPFIVAAPRFSPADPLGGLTQTAGDVRRVQDALSWFIARYPDLAQWHAIVERLATFHRAVVAARAAFGTGLALADAPDGPCGCAMPPSSCRTARSCWPTRTSCSSAAIRWSSPAAPGPANRRCSARWPASGRSATASTASRRTLPVPAAAAVYPAGLAATRRHLSASVGRLQPRGHRACAGGCRARAVRLRGWTTTSTGRSSSPAASSSGSPSPAPCWRSRTGCSWTRPPPAWIPRRRPSFTAP